jgi:hypothetical protein
VEFGHVLGRSLGRSEDLHFSVETVVDEQIVRHAYTVRLHGVTLPVVIVANVGVIVVTDFAPVTSLV